MHIYVCMYMYICIPGSASERRLNSGVSDTPGLGCQIWKLRCSKWSPMGLFF